MPISRTVLDAIRENLFPAAPASIQDWQAFPWHRNRDGAIDTHQVNSSQALAIDVFGTIKVSEDRDQILGTLARKCGMPDDGPWTLALEWAAPKCLLNEPKPTQVDALAVGKRAILLIECKFTERGGGCSQPNPLTKGANRGLAQCSGNYVLQTNPVNKIQARCALTGKKIQYWDSIPDTFGVDAAQDHVPCPFRGDAFQWMRNVVLMQRLSFAHGVIGAVVAAYADAEGLHTAEKVRLGALGHPPASGRALVIPLSFQSIIALAQSASEHATTWIELAQWVERKIGVVAAREQ